MNATSRNEFNVSEQDLNILENGMSLNKALHSKNELQERFYKIDLKNNRIVATSSQVFKKEQHCNLENLHLFIIKNIF